MRPSALVFLLALAAAAAAWVLAALPEIRRAGDLAARVATGDPAPGPPGVAAPAAADPARLEEIRESLRPPLPSHPPRGLSEGSPGTFAGLLPWEEVQAVLAWAADQPRAVLEIDVRPAPGDPSRAACRVVVGP